MNAEKRTITRTRHEYILETPVHVSELDKAMDWAGTDLMQTLAEKKVAGTSGVTVETRDDVVVLWWEERS